MGEPADPRRFARRDELAAQLRRPGRSGADDLHRPALRREIRLQLPTLRAQSRCSHNDDDDMTREPEMVKAYRDTWEFGLHSYLTYLRDRLLLARDLLHPSGSIFIQIIDENLHHVRELMDEIFGADNSVSHDNVCRGGQIAYASVLSIRMLIIFFGTPATFSA